MTRPIPVLGVAAKAVVTNPAGEVLVIRRSERSSVDPGRWDLPGGKMDDRERLVDALVREVREETGLEVDPARARPFHVSHVVKEPFWITCVTFVCPGASGTITLSPEHGEHRWVVPGNHAGLPYARAIEEQLDAFAAMGSGTGMTTDLSLGGPGGRPR